MDFCLLDTMRILPVFFSFPQCFIFNDFLMELLKDLNTDNNTVLDDIDIVEHKIEIDN